MKISKQARRDAKQLIKACRVVGSLDEAKVRQMVQQVIASKPRGYVAILSHFQRLVRLDLDRRTARVQSPVPLGDPQQAAIKANLARRYGDSIERIYRRSDQFVGEVLDRLDADTTVLVVSDHGARPMEGAICVNGQCRQQSGPASDAATRYDAALPDRAGNDRGGAAIHEVAHDVPPGSEHYQRHDGKGQAEAKHHLAYDERARRIQPKRVRQRFRDHRDYGQ